MFWERMDFLNALASAVDGDADRFMGSPRGYAPRDQGEYADKVKKAVRADVRMFSGCMDSQTSADVSNVSSFGLPTNVGVGGAGGACTNALLAELCGNGGRCTWVDLLRGMQHTLKKKRFDQVPQLSASRQIDLGEQFSMTNPRSNGRTKALLIGINYRGQRGELHGCHNDVEQMTRYITQHGGYRGEVRQLMDDGRCQNPTRAAIVESFRWLVAGAQPGDSLFFHYSGHGGNLPDDDGDEADGRDETMIPLDFKQAGQIRDDEIFRELVAPLPEGVHLMAVMDCCHSGTILDLPYMFVANDQGMSMIESGQVPQMQPNPGFSFAKMLKVGMQMYQMKQRGASGMMLGMHAMQQFGPDLMKLFQGGGKVKPPKPSGGGGGYGQPSGGSAPPPPQSGGYGPPPGAGGYGPPQGGYGPPQGGYGPPPQAGGYGPPPGSAGYGPPPQAGGYPPQGGGHGGGGHGGGGKLGFDSMLNQATQGMGKLMHGAGVNIPGMRSSSTLDTFQSGAVVQLISRTTGKALQIMATPDGKLFLDGNGAEGQQYTNSHWSVVRLDNKPTVQLYNQNNFLSIENGYANVKSILQGQYPGQSCNFAVKEQESQSVAFKSAAGMGCVGVEANGAVRSAAACSKTDRHSHFAVRTIYAPPRR